MARKAEQNFLYGQNDCIFNFNQKEKENEFALNSCLLFVAVVPNKDLTERLHMNFLSNLLQFSF